MITIASKSDRKEEKHIFKKAFEAGLHNQTRILTKKNNLKKPKEIIKFIKSIENELVLSKMMGNVSLRTGEFTSKNKDQYKKLEIKGERKESPKFQKKAQ